MKRYACVDDQKAAGFPVNAACAAAGVSTSAYYDHKIREEAGPTPRQLDEAAVVELMGEIFDGSDGSYGVPRMHRELRHGGLVVNYKRVECLMRRHGMIGRFRRRWVYTTIAGPDAFKIADLVSRRFVPGPGDVAWCQDITYIATRADLRDAGRGPTGGLSLDQLVQHPTDALQPRLHRPHSVGSGLPPSVITTVRPTGGCPMCGAGTAPTTAREPGNGS